MTAALNQDAVVDLYKSIYADLAVDRDESAKLKEFLADAGGHSIAGKDILWARSTAFRTACDFVDEDNTKNSTIALLRCLNSLVHAVETTCLVPKEPALNAQEIDAGVVTSFYQQVYGNATANHSQELLKFFQHDHPPNQASLTKARFMAFKVACEFAVDGDKAANVQLFRTVNAVVHAFEMSCLQPKPQVPAPTTNGHANGHAHVAAPDFMGMNFKSWSMSDAIQYLWKLDDNRLDPSKGDYTINVQGGKKPYWKGDQADDPLFTQVSSAALRRPSYAAFIALLDNYKAQTGQAEYVSHAERREIDHFLDTVLQTKAMQFCHAFCHQHDSNVSTSRAAFKSMLYKIWFELYSREGRAKDSSGFEHVFVGEIKNGKISGFHNWIHFYLQEKMGHVDYRGYIKPRNRSDALANEDDHLLTLQFTWHGVEKSVGSSFIGVSPEFELAMYTMCFLVGEQKNSIQLATGSVDEDTFELDIVCYKMAYDKVGTSYPEIQSHWEG